MNVKSRVLVIVAAVVVLGLALVAGGWFVANAYAQGTALNSSANAPYGECHDNEAVFDLLKTNPQDLLKERQAGKSLFEIATAKGIAEQQLIDALLQSVDQMHDWMGQNYPQSNAQQMTQYMRNQTTKDIRQTQYGTMTDFRLFGGSVGGMMGGANGYGGMMNGWNGGNGNSGGMMGGNSGMMGGSNGRNDYGGMMNGLTY